MGLKFSSILEKNFRKQKKHVSGSWIMDETYIKYRGRSLYLFRAVDHNERTIDFLLKKKRNRKAAITFFKKSIKVHDKPHKVVIDGSKTNKVTLREINKGLLYPIEI